MARTLDQRWKYNIVSYRRKCQKILLTSKSIRYVGLINEYGRTLTGIIRQGTNPMLNAGQVRDEFFLVSTMLSMRSTNYSAIGVMDYAILKHKKVILLIFQRKRVTYYISVDQKIMPDSLTKIINKIKKII